MLVSWGGHDGLVWKWKKEGKMKCDLVVYKYIHTHHKMRPVVQTGQQERL